MEKERIYGKLEFLTGLERNASSVYSHGILPCFLTLLFVSIYNKREKAIYTNIANIPIRQAAPNRNFLCVRHSPQTELNCNSEIFQGDIQF